MMALVDSARVSRERGRVPRRSTLLTNVLAVILRPLESCLGSQCSLQQEEHGANVTAKNLLGSFREENKLSMNNSKLSESLNEVKLVGWISPYTLLIQGPAEDLEVLKQAWKRRSLRNPAGFYIKDLGNLEDVVFEPILPAQFMSLTTALHDLITDLNNCGHCPSQGMITFYMRQLYTDMKVPDKDTMHKCLGMLIQDRQVYHNGRGYVALHNELDLEELRKPTDIRSIEDEHGLVGSVLRSEDKRRNYFSPDDMSLLNSRRRLPREAEDSRVIATNDRKNVVEESSACGVRGMSSSVRSEKAMWETEDSRKRKPDAKNTQAPPQYRNSFLSYSDDEMHKFKGRRKSSGIFNGDASLFMRKSNARKKKNGEMPTAAQCLFACVGSRPLTESRVSCADGIIDNVAGEEPAKQNRLPSTNGDIKSQSGSDVCAFGNEDPVLRASVRTKSSDSSKGTEKPNAKTKNKGTNTEDSISDYRIAEINANDRAVQADEREIGDAKRTKKAKEKKGRKKIRDIQCEDNEVEMNSKTKALQESSVVSREEDNSRLPENDNPVETKKKKKKRSKRTQTDFSLYIENAVPSVSTDKRDSGQAEFTPLECRKQERSFTGCGDLAIGEKKHNKLASLQGNAAVCPMVFDVKSEAAAVRGSKAADECRRSKEHTDAVHPTERGEGVETKKKHKETKTKIHGHDESSKLKNSYKGNIVKAPRGDGDINASDLISDATGYVDANRIRVRGRRELRQGTRSSKNSNKKFVQAEESRNTAVLQQAAVKKLAQFQSSSVTSKFDDNANFINSESNYEIMVSTREPLFSQRDITMDESDVALPGQEGETGDSSCMPGRKNDICSADALWKRSKMNTSEDVAFTHTEPNVAKNFQVLYASDCVSSQKYQFTDNEVVSSFSSSVNQKPPPSFKNIEMSPMDQIDSAKVEIKRPICQKAFSTCHSDLDEGMLRRLEGGTVRPKISSSAFETTELDLPTPESVEIPVKEAVLYPKACCEQKTTASQRGIHKGETAGSKQSHSVELESSYKKESKKDSVGEQCKRDKQNFRSGEDTDLDELRSFVLVSSSKPSPLYRHISNDSFYWDMKDEPECDQQSDQWMSQSDVDTAKVGPTAKTSDLLTSRETDKEDTGNMSQTNRQSAVRGIQMEREITFRAAKPKDIEKRRSLPVFSQIVEAEMKRCEMEGSRQQRANTAKASSANSLSSAQGGSSELKDKRARHSAMFEEKRSSLKVMGMV